LSIRDHLLDASDKGPQQRLLAEAVELLPDPGKPSGFGDDQTREGDLIGVGDEPENRFRKSFEDGLGIVRTKTFGHTAPGQMREDLVLVDARPVKFDHRAKDGFLAAELVVDRLTGDTGGLRNPLEVHAVISVRQEKSPGAGKDGVGGR
jgi:hypothetical protein